MLSSCRNGAPVKIVNQSERLSDRTARAMVKAIDIQVRHDFVPAHGLVSRRVKFVSPETVNRGDWVIALVDDAGEGALGWHTEDTDDFVFGTVGVNPVLDHGGNALTGELSVSSVLSHEVLELLLNPSISLWADTGQGYFVAREACDACQTDSYEIGGVAVSNFVYPDWFSPVVSRDDKYDHLGLITAPFQLRDGGYTLRCQGGEITEQFAAVPPPEWLMERKRSLHRARTHRLANSQPV